MSNNISNTNNSSSYYIESNYNKRPTYTEEISKKINERDIKEIKNMSNSYLSAKNEVKQLEAELLKLKKKIIKEKENNINESISNTNTNTSTYTNSNILTRKTKSYTTSKKNSQENVTKHSKSNTINTNLNK